MSDTLVKRCPACGHLNPPRESFCTECDFDLMHILAQSTQAASETPMDDVALDAPRAPDAGQACRLELLENGAIGFEIRPGQSVGRGVEADVLLDGVPHQAFISRRHALFFRRGEQWFVQYAASGNFIKVDGETYDDDSLVALHDGSLLTLSLTSFRVVLR